MKDILEKVGKTLGELLSSWCAIPHSDIAQIKVTDLQLDSRRVQSGSTFVAIVGHTMDGRQFMAKAAAQGANAIIAEADETHPHGEVSELNGVPVVFVAELSSHLSKLGCDLYGEHTNQAIAVTGTNGKTTISQLIAQWLTLLDTPAAVMGTTGNGFLDELKPALNTTGNAIEIQQTLHQLSQQGAQYTALEVSSHGLAQGRVKAVDFAASVFSNLSRDHLDYHGTMEAYEAAKKQLFTQHQCGVAIINVDDAVGQRWSKDLDNVVGVSLIGPPDTDLQLWARQVDYAESGIVIHFAGSWGEGTLQTPLIGAFNACNVLLAFATLLSLGMDKHALINTAPALQAVIGRMELFQQPQRAKVVVDYAHTPDALEKALSALRIHCQGRLWAIVGCGGDRDRGKRPVMANVAERFADHVILTDDNPRSESPEQIIVDMQAGLLHPEQCHVEHSRFDALSLALSLSTSDDIILMAGKGHEDYQIIGEQRIHYSDRESAQALLELNL
ncbi:MAG: UDP-N-acetylmuramoyl-L-alanyl-D-glutamate--2,6-diaminopimelate ligase [Vibrio sp.]